MKLEDIKKEMPKTPEMIHNRIQDEIKKQMEKLEENAGVCRAGEIKMSLPKSRLIFLDLLVPRLC